MSFNRRCASREAGWPAPDQPFDLLPGPAGGGIVVAHTGPGRNWRPSLILVREANARPANGLALRTGAFHARVTYLEPHKEPWRGPRQQLYVCPATPEHLEGDSRSVYWVIAHRRGRGTLKGLAELPGWSEAFGLRATALSETPAHLRGETASWFLEPDVEARWYHVVGGGDRSGFHFAVLLYLALHFRKVAGSRLQAMHLVANIDGKPNNRKHWARR